MEKRFEEPFEFNDAPETAKAPAATKDDEISFAPVEIVEDEKSILQRTVVSPIVAWARALAIKTAKDFENAGDYLKTHIKDGQKKVDALFNPTIEAANKTHKEACAAKKAMRDPLDEAERIAKDKLKAYRDEVERIQRAAEAKAAIETAKLQEEAAKLQRQAALAAAKGDEDKAMEKSEAAEAKAVQAATASVAQVAPPPLRKFTGFSIRKVWKWKVVDAEKIPREYLVPNEAALNGLARSAKGSMKVAGIEFYEE